MSTLKELIEKESPESQKKIKELTAELNAEYSLFNLRKELEVSQTDLAKSMNISQPSVQRIESRGLDTKLRTLKKYVEALGGDISLLINLPTGEGKVYRL